MKLAGTQPRGPTAARPAPVQARSRGPSAESPVPGGIFAGGESSFGYDVDSPISGEPTGGKKKSDDNGGPGAPDGLKTFSPATPNTKASGSAVGMVSVEKPQQADWDNGFDEKAAKRFSWGQRHESVAALGKNLKIDPAKEDTRISQLIICGHGNANMLAAGSGDGDDVSDALNIKESNKATWLPFFQRDKFYGQGEIWIISCNVGSGPIPQLIANQSGSTVYAYTRTAHSDEKVPFPGP